MTPVNLERAKQLVCAASLSYESDPAAIKASPCFGAGGFIDQEPLHRIDRGIENELLDSVLVGKTTFGVVVAFRGTLPPTQTDLHLAITSALDWFNDADIVQQPVPYSAGECHPGAVNDIETRRVQ